MDRVEKLQELLKHAENLHASLKSKFDMMFLIHTSSLKAIKQNPDITLQEWISLDSPGSLMERMTKDLASIAGVDYEEKLAEWNKLHEVKDSEVKLTKLNTNWQTVLNKGPLEFIPMPGLLRLMGITSINNMAKKYVTAIRPEEGYFELDDGTVYKFFRAGGFKVVKLDNYKIEYCPETEYSTAICRLVQI